MPKYNNNAGFKGYDNKDNPEKRTKVSPKMLVIIGSGAFIVVFVVIILIIAMSGNPDYDIKQSTTQSTTEESLNYDDVFGHGEDEDYTSESRLDDLYVETIPPVPQDSASSKSSSKSSSSSSSSKKDDKSSNSSKSSKSTKSNSSNTNSNNSQSHYNDENNYSNNSNNNNSGNNGTYSSNISNKSSSQSHYEYKDKTVSVTSVSISHSSISLTVGERANLSASAYPGNATDKSITWSSTNNSVASVSNGRVSAKSAGTCTIAAGTNNGVKAYCTVTVKNKAVTPTPVDNCRLNITSTTLYKKQQSTIRLEGAKKCSWDISNPYVVTVVKESGNYITVKAKKTGLTNVVATYNGKTYKCKVEVK